MKDDSTVLLLFLLPFTWESPHAFVDGNEKPHPSLKVIL